METYAGPSGRNPVPPEYPVRRLTRVIAIVLALLALGCGIVGLWSLTPETSGVGLIGFGCLLAIIGLLAQAAEHFARASAPRVSRAY
jgi:hypothetical protein